MTDEITGQLIGGPDDGNFVTGTVTEIPIVSTIDLWPDGKDSEPSTVVTKGRYVWQASGGYFLWCLESSEVLRRNVETV